MTDQAMQKLDLSTKLSFVDVDFMARLILGATQTEKIAIKQYQELFGFSYPTFAAMRDTGVVGKTTRKRIINTWNAFVDNGGAMPPVDEPAFQKIVQLRDRDSGMFVNPASVNPALIGLRGGKVETEAEVVGRITLRFDIMESMMRRILRGAIRSMILQAAPGVGKTYRIEKMLEARKAAHENFHYEVLSGGGVTPFALYKALYRARNTGDVIVLDDNDSLLEASNTEGINLLKNSLDSSDKRMLTWTKSNPAVYDFHAMPDPEDGSIPSVFEFRGAMVFITNMNFQDIAESGKKNSPHIAALIDRSYLVNLTILTLRDKILWCDHVFRNFMSQDLTPDVVEDVSMFVKVNKHKFFQVSCRLYNDIMQLAADQSDALSWKTIIEATKFRSEV